MKNKERILENSILPRHSVSESNRCWCVDDIDQFIRKLNDCQHQLSILSKFILDDACSDVLTNLKHDISGMVVVLKLKKLNKKLKESGCQINQT